MLSLSSSLLGLSRISERQLTVFAKQVAVFERLTDVAAWVQDCTKKVCDSITLNARAERNAARRHLVPLWVREVSESERYTITLPLSEGSQVFHPA